MKEYPAPLDLKRVRVYPLLQRDSLSFIDRMLVDPKAAPRGLPPEIQTGVERCIQNVHSARQRGASVILMYGAHLIKNGAMPLVNLLLD